MSSSSESTSVFRVCLHTCVCIPCDDPKQGILENGQDFKISHPAALVMNRNHGFKEVDLHVSEAAETGIDWEDELCERQV